MCNKKGFTLIELLAIIVILGILLLIAIVSVGKIIDNSKRKAYISSVLVYVKAAKEKEVVENNTDGIRAYKVEDLDVTENTSSPFGKYEFAYVIANCENSSCKYYFISLDEAGYYIGTYNQKNRTISPIEVNKLSKNGKDILQIKDVDGYQTAIDFSKPSYLNSIVNMLRNMKNVYNDIDDTFKILLQSNDESETNKLIYIKTEGNGLVAKQGIVTKERPNGYPIGFPYPIKLSETESQMFTTLKDNADTVILVQQNETDGIVASSLEKYVADIKTKWNSDGIKEIRLLDIDDFKPLATKPTKMFCNVNCSTPIDTSIITRFNINSPVVKVAIDDGPKVSLLYTFIANEKPEEHIYYYRNGKTETGWFQFINSTSDTRKFNYVKKIRGGVIGRVKFVIEVEKGKGLIDGE